MGDFQSYFNSSLKNLKRYVIYFLLFISLSVSLYSQANSRQNSFEISVNAEPVRPTIMIAVIKGANSRNTAMPSKSTIKILAP